ncbi:hypothetical protein Ciccas_006674 [Cichlidogyrus casuarinus]|uniref:Uncharacterized protein n=1 Tax=Cichlidogyrus casuarinus TaxID=1844966 RepID=A0ABD2Q545_9PLAT
MNVQGISNSPVSVQSSVTNTVPPRRRKPASSMLSRTHSAPQALTGGGNLRCLSASQAIAVTLSNSQSSALTAAANFVAMDAATFQIAAASSNPTFVTECMAHQKLGLPKAAVKTTSAPSLAGEEDGRAKLMQQLRKKVLERQVSEDNCYPRD